MEYDRMYVENQGPAYDFFIKPTALPVLPPSLTQCVLNYDRNDIITRSTDRLLRGDCGSYANAQITRHPVERELSDWIQDHVASGFTDVSVQVVDRAQASGAHTDKLRCLLLARVQTGHRVELHSRSIAVLKSYLSSLLFDFFQNILKKDRCKVSLFN